MHYLYNIIMIVEVYNTCAGCPRGLEKLIYWRRFPFLTTTGSRPPATSSRPTCAFPEIERKCTSSLVTLLCAFGDLISIERYRRDTLLGSRSLVVWCWCCKWLSSGLGVVLLRAIFLYNKRLVACLRFNPIIHTAYG